MTAALRTHTREQAQSEEGELKKNAECIFSAFFFNLHKKKVSQLVIFCPSLVQLKAFFLQKYINL